MRVLLFSTAGSGHFLPAVPYARALVAAGHSVAVCAPSSFRPAVEKADFPMLARPDLPPDALGRVLASLAGLSVEERNLIYAREIFGRLNLENGLQAARDAVRDWRPDVVLREEAEITGLVAAQEAGTPEVQVGIGLQRFAQRAWEGVMGDVLTGAGLREAAAAIANADRLTATPPTLDTKSERAGGTHRFRTDPNAAAAAELPDWWPGKSDPLVYMTLGDEAARMGLFPEFFRALAGTIAGLPVRVLFTIGAAADPAALGSLPANVHVERWWPQDRVLPLASAVIFHGGYGTMLSALAAGVPSVSIPLFSLDQHWNAARLAEVGAGIALQGPEAIAGLPDALRQVMDDESFRGRAAELAKEISTLPPPAEAVAIVESVAASR